MHTFGCLIEPKLINVQNESGLSCYSKHLCLSLLDSSLQSNLPRLFKLAIDNIGTDNISSEAIKTIRLIVADSMKVKQEGLLDLITELVKNIDVHHSNLLVASEIYQLLTTLHAKYPNLIARMPHDIINKTIDAGHCSLKLTDDNLPMQMYRLQWFLLYTSQNERLLPILKETMKNKDVHYIFANGLRTSNEGLYFSYFVKNNGFLPLNSLHSSDVRIRSAFSSIFLISTLLFFYRNLYYDNETYPNRTFSIELCV